MKFNCNWKLPINFISQSAKRKLLLNNPTDRTFENRRSRYKELGKKVPQAYRVYVEDTFLPCDAGDARIFSKEMTHTENQGDNEEQKAKRYYYHSDHLGSAQFVTDWKGRQYEHIEYTPYGELWIEEVAAGIDKLPFRFTGKELDEETGLYYYGARYLDPKYSRWLSGDPALNDYIPKAPINDEAKKHNENLPGMGGVFNTVNLHVYHYAGNNPVKYVDPDGKALWDSVKIFFENIRENTVIHIERSYLDNGNLGRGVDKYFKSTFEVRVYNIAIITVSVQSTADHPNLNNGNPQYNGMTLPEGEYNIYLLEKSNSYTNPMHIINEALGASLDDNFLVHPDQFTEKTGGPWLQPYGLGCQILKMKDFNKINSFFKKLGFEYKGTLNDRDFDKYGSKIKMIIKDSLPILDPNIFPMRDEI
nr:MULTISPECIES: RHS repeat-associated core domain-containing protein [unclassified Treponema]